MASIGLLQFAAPATGARAAVQRLVRTAYTRLERTPARWLKEFLVQLAPGLRDRVRSGFMVAGVDWAHTKAYADPVGSTIRLNLAGREPNGTVQPGRESEEVLSVITKRLLVCKDEATGTPAVEAVLRREEAYSGPALSLAPELTILWNQHVPVARLSSSLGEAGDFPTEQFRAISGDHRLEGVLMMAGPGVAPGAVEGASIVDLFPTIARLMGVAVPAGLDGRVLREAAAGGAPEEAPALPAAAPSGGRAAREYTASEEEEIRDRLRGLGYLE